MYETIDEIIRIIRTIIDVEDVEIKNCALESLIDKLEDLKGKQKGTN